MPQLVKEVCRLSFNCVTVDGDTSTNDSFILIATGQAGNAEIADLASADYAALKAALSEVAIGWRRRWRATAKGRPSSSSWRSKAAATVPNASRSPTPSRARRWSRPPFRQRPNLGASLPPWLCRVTDLDVNALQFTWATCRWRAGRPRASYTEAQGAAVMKEAEIVVRVVLNRGHCDARVDLRFFVRLREDQRGIPHLDAMSIRISAEQAAFLQGPLSINVGAVGRDGWPCVCRAQGARGGA